MESIDDIQSKIIADFSLLTDWSERYAYIMELGQKLPVFPEQYRTPGYLVKGCQSQVWLHAALRDGKMHFDATSDSLMVSGLIYLLLQVYNDRLPGEILRIEPKFIDAIGLTQHLSANRRNGLFAMLQRMRELASPSS